MPSLSGGVVGGRGWSTKSSANSSSNTPKFPPPCTSSVFRRTTALAASDAVMVLIWLTEIDGLVDQATIEVSSAVLDRSLDLLKQRSHELFGRDLALGDTHRSAGLHERHLGDADEGQDVPQIGNFIVIGFHAGSFVIASSARYRDNHLAALGQSLRSCRKIVESFSTSY